MHKPKRSNALTTLVEDHSAMVGRIASTYEARPHLAEELVQDVFLAVWRALDSFRGDASARTFVARIAHNVCTTHVRREVRRKTMQLEEAHLNESPSAEDATHALDVRTRLLDAVRQLPLPNRQIVSLHLEGFSNAEVGEALGMSEGNVAVRLTRLRKTLKEQLGGGR